MDARLVVAAIAVCALLAAGTAASAPPAPAPHPSADTQIEYDSTLLRIDVGADGDAAWTIEYRVAFDGGNETQAAFDQLSRDIEANQSEFEDEFASRMERTARSAENTTGRRMRIENVSVEAETEVTAGVVRYTFEWTNFANASGDGLRVGDAVAGMLLDADTTLTIAWPERYGVAEIRPADADERRNGVAIWYGQKSFGTDEPLIVLAERTPTPTASGNAPGESPTPTDDGPATGGIGPLIVVAGLLVVGLAVAGYLWQSGRIGGSGPAPASDGAESGGGGAAAAPADDTDEATEATPEEELLSNEERVLRLLEENGGRMKQQQVVSELGWTDAKTSQVVGSLRDDEKIEAFRIGRENVLALPGETDF